MNDTGGKQMLKLKQMMMIIILSIALVLPTLADAGEAIGTITRLKGKVTIYRGGAKIGISATNGMDLQQNDKIKTKAKSYLRFKLKDGSIMTLGQKAELTLDAFTYNPKQKKRVAFFKVAVGKLRVFANRMMKYRDNRFQIKTPTAVAGVRGTVFMVWVESPTVTRIACFDSAVEVSSVFKPDEYVVLTKNILTSISKGKVPTQPVLMTEKMFKSFQGGFEGDIKPADEETGFKDEDDGDDSGGEEQREAPDPTDFKDIPPVPDAPELPGEGPDIGGPGDGPIIEKPPEIPDEPDPEDPPAESVVLPVPPGVPAGQ